MIARKTVPLARPDVGEEEIDAVVSVLRTPILSIGPKIEEFEERCAAVAGRRYGVAVNSGTSALHLIVRGLGIGQGDEVITTPFSFVASSNVLLYERAKPVFVDIDPLTYNIDIDWIEAAITSRTKAILVVDVFGQAVNMLRLAEIAKRYDLLLIEDSCEAIGGAYDGVPCGHLGDAGAFAFYPNKQITTGEGGVLVTDSADLYRMARSLRNQGRGEASEWLAHDRLGYNYRLSEINAVLGVEQIKRLDEILAKRSEVARKYTERLQDIPLVTPPRIDPRVRMSWFVYVVRVDETVDRDKLMVFLRERGVGCRPYFSPIHLQPFYRQMFGYREGDFPITEDVAKSTIALPFFNRITDEEIDYVCEMLREGIVACRK
ncbi:DegT/DnrJ/EryC1/StrS family aminotransferase [Kyrpidia tusciae]|uniref:Glutamine--scyllo-inositol transaminase n=1 Tax=Kyrpidia tusciae (strain DSM 2912 / NBRC 15312 / T2) TaxID=562970 RepID=D5WVZ6_KYRT2|nr:DegT/DnrJ/EryC1/StrS family aminotransferase [Kyrpidia tusciae]ADG05628.1 Glutamine--scyllo-inositol transaminase [Kyrpidia tusciae DSM 2912]